MLVDTLQSEVEVQYSQGKLGSKKGQVSPDINLHSTKKRLLLWFLSLMQMKLSKGGGSPHNKMVGSRVLPLLGLVIISKLHNLVPGNHLKDLLFEILLKLDIDKADGAAVVIDLALEAVMADDVSVFAEVVLGGIFGDQVHADLAFGQVCIFSLAYKLSLHLYFIFYLHRNPPTFIIATQSYYQFYHILLPYSVINPALAFAKALPQRVEGYP